MSADAFNKAFNEVNGRCFALVNSSDIQDKLAGVTAIDRIVDVLGNDMSRALRLAASVQRAFPCPDPLVMTLAAKVFARLAAQGGSMMSTQVDVQVRSCIEWLQGERIEQRRYAAVLVLREVIRLAPALIYDHIPDLLDNLWTALRDPKVAIREAAADALGGCLSIASVREGQLALDANTMVLEQAQRGFSLNSPEAIHGSLLGYKELFVHGKWFMHDRYNDVCDHVLYFKDHRDSLVRRAVIELIPTLASYNHTQFTESYLHKAMVYLLAQLKRERERTTAFHAIGHVANAVKGAIAPYLESILSAVREGLSHRGRKGAPSEDSIFTCISMLAEAAGPTLTKHMHDLLDLMFTCELSRTFRKACLDICTFIPALRPIIQERLLDVLSVTLSGHAFKTPGAPAHLNGSTALSSSTSRHSAPPSATFGASFLRDSTTTPPSGAAADVKDPAMVELALETLGTFQFENHLLSEFVRDCVVNYLEDDNPAIRKMAALTCCNILARDPIVLQASTRAIKLVNDVLEKLLALAIADPDPTIRQATMSSLDPRFDRHLAQAECVRSLFIALNDEVYAIREIAIKVIGRLANLNPAYVMPSLRKTLIQLLTELEYSSSSRSKEESATLLGLLIGASHRLTKPYVTPMMNVLLPRSRDSSPNVAAAIMTTLGELSRVGGEDVLPQLDTLMSLILDTLHDQSSTAKRDAALRALGQISSHAGYVIDPYIDHSTLLALLCGLLKSEQAPQTRRELVRVMGTLGAIDPFRHTVIEGISNDAAVETFNATDPMHPSNIGPSHEEYYPTVAFTALLSVLNDPSLSDHHTAAVDAIIYIFRSLRLKVVSFLPQVLPALLAVTRTCPVGLQEYYFQNLGQLITMVKQHVRNHLGPIMTLVRDFWASTSNPSLQVIIVDVIEAISVALEAEFKAYLPNLLPLLLQTFQQDLHDVRRQSTLLKVLQAFGIFGTSLEEYLHLIIPAIVQAFETPEIGIQIRKQALLTITQLCHKINFADHASRIIHPIARVLVAMPSDLRVPVMEALCALVLQMGADFVLFVPMINKVRPAGGVVNVC